MNVLLPMALQLPDTIALQGAELDRKVKLVRFWIFGPRIPLMGKDGFEEKLQK